MHTDAPLNRREQDILYSVVKEYIETGEPVGSRTISKQRDDSLSAASIRNVMADLADEGYLSQPHTSAGRVPTEKAFRNYVSHISAGRVPLSETERLRAELTSLATFEERIERTSYILMEMSRNVGIAAAVHPQGQALEQVELVPLADRRVLMILVTRDGAVRNRMVTMEEAIGADELASIRNYVNRNFSGWQLGDARRELVRRMAEERAAYDATLRRLSVLYYMGLLESDAVPEVHLEGASNLVGIDLHLTREKMRELMRALEEKKRLVELLDRFLENPPGELAVKVGLVDASPVMKDLVLIGVTLNTSSGFSARLAVLGPMRMHYERVMGAVLHIGRAFETM
jgi:heat-inducible transcriptional repressor